MLTIEIDIQNGLPLTNIVGLPDNVIKESKERVRSAIRNSGYKYPSKRVTINLSPAHTKKEGPAFDLAIAAGILAASEQIPSDLLEQFVLLGELSLDGTIKPVKGCLPIALGLDQHRFKGLITPPLNANEAALCQTTRVFPVKTLTEFIQFLREPATIPPFIYEPPPKSTIAPPTRPDFADVKGQAHVKRGLEIAAAGGHNVIMIGPPGSGKSMLAKRFASILPDMNQTESFETTRIYSVMGLLKEHQSFLKERPFRSVHHTTSAVALVGGGTIPKPGEITLSHNGVLFLDELPEFNRQSLEALRQPLEDHMVTIARANKTLHFPARFILLSAMNPCPCGHYTNPMKSCHCSQSQIHRYLSKISGPLLDRIDIHLEVPPLSADEILNSTSAEPSQSIKSRTVHARQIQDQRFANNTTINNAQMTHQQLKQFCNLVPKTQNLLSQAIEHLSLSARAHDKVLKIARTIADLDNEQTILDHHIAEAIQYRCLDRKWWGP